MIAHVSALMPKPSQPTETKAAAMLAMVARLSSLDRREGQVNTDFLD
jgi:hypothetical protein